MTKASPKELQRLAVAYEPTWVFSSGERVFPVQVESYLSHTSGAAWKPGERDSGVAAETTGGPHHRGTAIMDGAPPGTLLDGRSDSGAPLGSEEIGRRAYKGAKASAGLFITFGGWRNAECTDGNADYLRAAFSELAAAMDPKASWEEFEALPNRPVLWTGQPTTPTVYAEASWCGDHLRADRNAARDKGAARDFAEGADAQSLPRLLALTYHLFFPLQDSVPSVTERLREGQWEAATVFFGGVPGPPEDPAAFEFAEPPLAVVLSRSTALESTVADCRRWRQTVRDGSHPRIHVSRGRHQLLFASPDDPAGNVPTVSGGAAEVTRLAVEDPGQHDFPGSEVLLVLGLVLTSPLLLFLWLISFVVGLIGDINNGPNGRSLDASTPAGDGAGPVSSPSGTAKPGEVIGSEFKVRVDDPAVTLLRFVDAVDRDPRRTIWPDEEDPGAPPPPVEYPYWWDFAGSWGIAVPPHATEWASGSHRVDGDGRSLGYRNTVALARAWALGQADRPA
ncbi:hypothetical protein ACFVJ4_41020 [Streptomyces sp. NPDC127178]|uniref:hypothetical protein n=1 Tax=unclassified Streptomyces TaxID=2593676 RepID=UPI00363E3D69